MIRILKSKYLISILILIIVFASMPVFAERNMESHLGAKPSDNVVLTSEEIQHEELKYLNAVKYLEDYLGISYDIFEDMLDGNIPAQKALDQGLFASGDSWYLSVPIRHQEGLYWCGPACVQMILRYKTDTEFSQSSLASDMNCGPTGVDIYSIRNRLRQSVPSADYGVSDTVQRPLRAPMISSINKAFPLVYLVQTGNLVGGYSHAEGTDYTHYVVGSGYAWGTSVPIPNVSTSVRYIDPYKPSVFGFTSPPDTVFGSHDIDYETMVVAINAASDEGRGDYCWGGPIP